MIHYQDDAVTLYHGDCIDVMRGLPDASVHAVVTDPPYALEFMGRGWDKFTPLEFEAWCTAWAAECLRVLKPGGHLLAFGGTRTWHRLAAGIEDAGFEIRDSIAWVYAQGFPKSLDVSKAIDRVAGAEREVVRARSYSPTDGGGYSGGLNTSKPRSESCEVTAPATPDAARWQGWGTALKPSHEPIVVARKPLSGTVAATVLAHGTGAINVDGCRVGTGDNLARPYGGDNEVYGKYSMARGSVTGQGLTGRWPPNVLLDPTTAAELDRQSGETVSPPVGSVARTRGGNTIGTFAHEGRPPSPNGHGDRGGASRMFPVFKFEPKASTAERPRVGKGTGAGIHNNRCGKCGRTDLSGSPCSCPEPEWIPRNSEVVSHPTVKPLDLMRWLVRLVTPPGGTVLEPFSGSGTTAEACVIEGFQCIAIEREADYLPLNVQRLTKPIETVLDLGGIA